MKWKLSMPGHRKSLIKTIIALFLTLFGAAPEALPQSATVPVERLHGPDSRQMKQFAIWEAHHNPVRMTKTNQFNPDLMPIPHIEFPLQSDGLYVLNHYPDWFTSAHMGPHAFSFNFADYLPTEVKDRLIFEKKDINGDIQTWVRWPLSPHDKKFYKIIKKYLDDQKVPNELVSNYFQGRPTASRSMIIVDPATGHSFSFKTSTDGTSQGQAGFEYRPYPVYWGHLNRRLSDYYYSIRERLKHLDIAWEAAFFGLPPINNSAGELIDSAMSVRLMEPVSRGESYHMSGFVLEDEKEIHRLAKLASMTTLQFINEISLTMGRALVELNFVLGFVVSSAHLQNIRFELDQNYRPTGKAILLDLTDGRPIRAIMEANGQHSLLDEWAKNPNIEHFNQIADKPQWAQSDFRWLRPMRLNKVQDGMRERLRQITTLSKAEIENITASEGIIRVNFTNNADFQAKLVHNCGGFLK